MTHSCLKSKKKGNVCFLNQNWTKYSRLFGKVLVPITCLCLTTDQSSTRSVNLCVIEQRTTRSSVGIWKSIVTYNTSCIIQNKGKAHCTDNLKILDYREVNTCVNTSMMYSDFDSHSIAALRWPLENVKFYRLGTVSLNLTITIA